MSVIAAIFMQGVPFRGVLSCRRALSRASSRRSWPQAALMSVPRRRRTVALTPRRSSSRWKRRHIFFVRGRVRAAVHRVDGDQIHMRAHPLDQVRQFVGHLVAVVDTAHHRILKADAAAGLFLVAAAGRDELFQRVGVVDRHHAERVALSGACRRDRERQLQMPLGQFVDLGHQAAGRKADVAHADVDAFGQEMICKKSMTLSKLCSGSPMPMSTMWGDTLPRVLLGGVDLGRDLAGGQVPHATPPGSKRRTGSPSHSPPGWTRRPCCRIVTHEHRLDAVAVGQLQKNT